MRISTKIILGYGILFALMAGLAAYQVFIIHRMQHVLSTVSAVNFQSADMALQMMRDLDFVDDFTKKSFASDDPRYPEALRDYRSLFEADLAKIEQFGLTDPEKKAIQRLAYFWRLFPRNWRGSRRRPGRLISRRFPPIWSTNWWR